MEKEAICPSTADKLMEEKCFFSQKTIKLWKKNEFIEESERGRNEKMGKDMEEKRVWIFERPWNLQYFTILL